MRYVVYIYAGLYVAGMLCFTRFADFGSTDKPLTAAQELWTNIWAAWNYINAVLPWVCIYHYTMDGEKFVSFWMIVYTLLIAIWRITAPFIGIQFNDDFAVLLAFFLLVLVCAVVGFARHRRL
jgi:hypothetical protein